MDEIFKSFQLDVKSLDLKKLAKGELTVVFATMGVWDKDGDFAEPGFYGQQDVQFIPTHDWSHVWLGKGVTREDGNLAVADIKMNLEIQAARDWLSAIKFDLEHGKPIGEYSYGFKTLEGGTEMGERLGRRGRILKPREDGTPGCKIWEVSPVLVGAGEKTRTLTAKASKTGMAFVDECQAALDAADSLVERAKALAALREKDGRGLSAPAMEKLAAMAISMETCVKELAALSAPAKVADPVPTAAELDGKKELARMVKNLRGIR